MKSLNKSFQKNPLLVVGAVVVVGLALWILWGALSPIVRSQASVLPEDSPALPFVVNNPTPPNSDIYMENFPQKSGFCYSMTVLGVDECNRQKGCVWTYKYDYNLRDDNIGTCGPIKGNFCDKNNMETYPNSTLAQIKSHCKYYDPDIFSSSPSFCVWENNGCRPDRAPLRNIKDIAQTCEYVTEGARSVPAGGSEINKWAVRCEGRYGTYWTPYGFMFRECTLEEEEDDSFKDAQGVPYDTPKCVPGRVMGSSTGRGS